MRRTAIAVMLTTALVGLWHGPASAQPGASVAGKWDVTIRMPDKSVSEQWTVQQKGKVVTGTAKAERELPVTGSIDGAFLRVTVTDGKQEYKVRATVDGDAMDGSITYGPGKEYLWHAKRPKK